LNSFGKILRLTSFGESHGLAVGGVLDGFPAGIDINTDFIRTEMQRRKPGQSALSTERNEDDEVQFISGIFEGKSTGAPIAFLIYNKDKKSSDYDALKDVFRPSHADYTYQEKYGIRDHRGGGRSSARETAVRVAAGAMAKWALKQHQIEINGYVSQVGNIRCPLDYTQLNLEDTDSNPVRCPHNETAQAMEQYILTLKEKGDTIGGTITCVIKGCKPGLGAPLYAKLHAELGAAMLGINAVKGFDYGSGFSDLDKTGSVLNDTMRIENETLTMESNHSGGIQGGISNGSDIYFRVAFKPVATIKQVQQTVNKNGENITIHAEGRHDPCVLPRAVPIVEAMAALVMLDHFLMAQTTRML